MKIASLTDEIIVLCPYCGKTIEVLWSQMGSEVSCCWMGCEQDFLLPNFSEYLMKVKEQGDE